MLQRLLLFFLIALPLQASAQNSSIDQQVVIVNAGPPGVDELGAGMIVGELNNRLYVVTAYHVVEDFPDMIDIRLAKYPQKVSARIDHTESGWDLAILSMEIPDGYTTTQSFSWAEQLPEETEEVIVIGHPNGALWDINRIVRIKNLTVSSDYFRTLLTLYPNGLDNGNSGGAVLNQDHQLIAMVQEVSGNKVTCLRTSMIQRVLQENGFPDNLMTVSLDQDISYYTDRYAGDMVWIEGGSFMMGSNEGGDDEKPVHRVNLDGFWMGKYEVTNEQFCVFLNEKGNQLELEAGSYWLEIASSTCEIIQSGSRFIPIPGMENHPVHDVSWYGAKAYAAWMSEKTGHNYHLPTEAQWEYAARGGLNARSTTYAGSNKVDEVGWDATNSDSTTHPVGQKAANELGLYDMSGNLWEFCADWYASDYYANSPSSNPKGPASGELYRVLRSGSWNTRTQGLRVAERGGSPPDSKGANIGFRLCRTP